MRGSATANEIPEWFKSEIVRLFALYPAATLSTATMIAWWSVLHSTEPNAVRRGIRRAAARSSCFIPSAMAVLAATSDEGKAESGAIVAWPELLRLAKRSSGTHSDPIAREAIRLMGGGKRLGQMGESELEVWGKKEFERLYLDVAERFGRRSLQLDPPAGPAGSLGGAKAEGVAMVKRDG